MDHDAERPAGPSAESRRRAAWFWVPVVFVIGLLAGGVIVAVFSGGDSARPAAPRPTVTVTESPPDTGTQPRVLVDPACLRAIKDARSAYSVLSKVSAALRDLNPAALGGLVQQIRGIEKQLQRELRGCHATLEVPPSSTPLPAPAGTG